MNMIVTLIQMSINYLPWMSVSRSARTVLLYMYVHPCTHITHCHPLFCSCHSVSMEGPPPDPQCISDLSVYQISFSNLEL